MAGIALMTPALIVLCVLFIYPLGYSLLWAFRNEEQGAWSFANFIKAWDFYSTDILFTILIVTLSALLIGVCSILIAGYLTLGENRTAIVVLRWLYRWPLFIPFVVAGQLMRTFLAKNGMMNNILVSWRSNRTPSGRELSGLAGNRYHVRLETDSVRGAPVGRRDGHARPVDNRGGEKPWCRANPGADSDRGPPGRHDADGGPDPLLCADDVGSVRSADDKRTIPDHDDG